MFSSDAKAREQRYKKRGDVLFASFVIAFYEAKCPSRAPRSARSKAGGNPVWEGLANHPVSSLGTEAVTPGLSVGRKGSRPKAQAEDIEPRNHQWARSMHGTSRRQHCS